jgi:hypothetical protein
LWCSGLRSHISADISTQENGGLPGGPFRHIDIHILVGRVLYVCHETQFLVGRIVYGFSGRKFNASRLSGRGVKDESFGWNGGAAGSGKNQGDQRKNNFIHGWKMDVISDKYTN